MAFSLSPEDDEQKKLLTGAAGSVGGTGAAVSPSTAQVPKQQGTGFQNLGDYLALNQNSANQMGQGFAAGLGTQADAARGAITGAGDATKKQAKSQFNPAGDYWDTSAGSFAGKSFGEIAAPDAQNNADKAVRNINNTQSLVGIQAQQERNNPYGTLDAYLTGQGGASQLEQLRSKNKDLGELYGKTEKSSNKYVDDLSGEFIGAKFEADQQTAATNARTDKERQEYEKYYGRPRQDGPSSAWGK